MCVVVVVVVDVAAAASFICDALVSGVAHQPTDRPTDWPASFRILSPLFIARNRNKVLTCFFSRRGSTLGEVNFR